MVRSQVMMRKQAIGLVSPSILSSGALCHGRMGTGKRSFLCFSAEGCIGSKTLSVTLQLCSESLVFIFFSLLLSLLQTDRSRTMGRKAAFLLDLDHRMSSAVQELSLVSCLPCSPVPGRVAADSSLNRRK